ncbi:MAG: helix-turn-helix transcriptional regulator [Clostridiales bacterium]|nr:helix-turn-helix transcriptional regulator [Clostridiales bacterium]
MLLVMDMNNYSLGELIKSLRVSNRLTQEKLAFKAEITSAYLGQIERNEKNPTINCIKKICDAVDISLCDFFACLQNDRQTDVITLQIDKNISEMTYAQKEKLLEIIENINDFKKL